MTFPQTILRFRPIPSLLGLASFDKNGDMIDTTLPLSDLLCEEIGARFLGVTGQCHDVGRVQNHFVLEYGNRTLVFAEHAKGSLLFMLGDRAQLDSLLALFGNHYRDENNVVSLPQPSPKLAPLATESPRHPSSRRKKNPLLWAASGLTAAVALAAAVPSNQSDVSLPLKTATLESSVEEAELKLTTEQLIETQETEKMALNKPAQEKAEMIRLAAEQKAAEEAERLAAAEQAAAEENERIAAKELAMREKADADAEAERLAAIAIKKASVQKHAVSKKRTVKKKYSYRRKAKTSCQK